MNIVEKGKREFDILRLHSDYKAIFLDDERGKRVFAHLVKTFNGDTFVAGAPDMTAHREGRRYVIISICKYLKRDPAELLKQLELGE